MKKPYGQGAAMKIYVAGKITGDSGYRLKFDRYASVQRRADNIVLNPAILPAGLEHHEYLHICFAMIDTADCVHFLRDWRESKGTRIEHDYCRQNGKSVFYVLEDMGEKA
jgi:hypothetical protein